MTLDYLTLSGARQLLDDKKVSSVELTEHYLQKISKTDPTIHSYVTVVTKGALEQARASDKRRADGTTLSPIDGVPGALKDVFTTKGILSTASAKILENFVPPYSAHVTQLLEDAGMVLLGKTNLDEFAMGTTTEYSAFGVTRNPWNTNHVAGGSSGGSAACVAADQALMAFGTDTGGSIRLPAAWTGVVGLRPTYGRVSRRGIIAMASSLDQVGTFTRSIADAATLLEIIATHDPLDSTSVKREIPNYSRSLGKDLKGTKIGVIKEYFSEGVDQHIQQTVREAVDQLKKLGATIEEVSVPLAELALAVYCIIVPAEVSTNLERYDGIRYGFSVMDSDSRLSLIDIYNQSRREGFGSEAKRRSMLGAYVLSEGYYDKYFEKAQKVRALITRQFHDVFQDVDCLVGPVSPTSAFRIGENEGDPLKTWMADLLAVPVNIAGLPGMSVPCGFDGTLPVGMQIIANQFAEEKIFAVASAFEASTDWHLKYPPMSQVSSQDETIDVATRS